MVEKTPSCVIGKDGRRESKRSYAAFLDYCQLGPARSLDALRGVYYGQTKPPTTSLNTLKQWSANFVWGERAEKFDADQQKKIQNAYDARRREIMESGLALTHERVEKLKKLYEQVEGYLADKNNIWLPDVKSIRVGSTTDIGQDGKSREVGEYERVEIVKFNAAIFDQLRGLLDDLAAETGGRTEHVEQHNSGTIEHKTDPKDHDRFNTAISTLADALRESLPGTGPKPNGQVDTGE